MNKYKVYLGQYDFEIEAEEIVHEAPVILFYVGIEIVASVPESSIIIKKN